MELASEALVKDFWIAMWEAANTRLQPAVWSTKRQKRIVQTRARTGARLLYKNTRHFRISVTCEYSCEKCKI